MIRILLADDNPEFLKAVTRFLSRDPALEIVGYAHSGSEALGQVSRLRPDLVLMDVAMPDMNGLEATRCIKAQPGAPYVIILTLYDHLEYQALAETAGADGFISKSNVGRQVLSLIHSLVARGADA